MRIGCLLAVTLAELVDLARGLQNMLLAGVERVRRAGNLKFDQRIFLAIFPLDLFLGVERGAGQDSEIGRGILENHGPRLRVYALFHNSKLQTLNRKGGNSPLFKAKVQGDFSRNGFFLAQGLLVLQLMLKYD